MKFKMFVFFRFLIQMFVPLMLEMARSQYNQFDGIRGKLGQFVGSRNASGNILRKLSKPTNPNTASQQTARNNMRVSGKGYASLTEAQQGGWTNFAKTLFNPLKGKHTGTTNGHQAYAAVSATIFNFGGHQGSTNIQGYGEASPVAGVTFNNSTVNSEPPISTVSGNIVDTADTAAGFKLRQGAFDSAYTLWADIDIIGYQGTGLTGSQFVDNKGNKYGFGFYLSNPLNFVGQRAKNQYHSFMGFTGFPVKAGGIVATFRGFRLQLDASPFIAGHKNQPTTGQIFLMSLVVMAENGTVSKVDSCYVTFGNAVPVLPS